MTKMGKIYWGNKSNLFELSFLKLLIHLAKQYFTENFFYLEYHLEASAYQRKVLPIEP